MTEKELNFAYNAGHKAGIKSGFIQGVEWMEFLLTNDKRFNGRLKAIVRRARKDLLYGHGWEKK